MERTGTTSKINNTEKYSNHRTGNIKITILIDNVPDNNKCLHYEHGLSMFIETKDKRFIVDTGLTGLFAKNAKTLGIDLSTLDFCKDISRHYPDIQIITGHCTCDKAKSFLQKSSLNIKFFHTESSLII